MIEGITLTEALKRGDLVRRKSWPWWKCLNNEAHDTKRIWVVTDNPRKNGWCSDLSYEAAIANDWEVVTEIP